MKKLSEIRLKYRYRTGKNDLVKDFFEPCLNVARLYRRAVGFFSASSLVTLSRGLKGLLRNNGKIQLIASPILSAEDIEAIKKGYDIRDSLEASCLRQLECLDWSYGVEALAWLISDNRLDIKLAIRSNIDEYGGIYHEKLGIIEDCHGNFITFSGSVNESISAHVYNFESFDVDFSWNDYKGLANEKLSEFNDLWDNKTPGLDIYAFPEAAKMELLKIRKSQSEEEFISRYCNSQALQSQSFPTIPEKIELRDYQKNAIHNWWKNNGRGIFKMATGTGKTITALAAVVKVIEAYRKNNKPISIIIVCPYKHLVTQWDEECYNFNIETIKCFDTQHRWLEYASIEALSSDSHIHKYSCYISTNTTFALPSFQSIINKISSDILIVADEAHNIGTLKQLQSLPAKASYRLALSATPDRWYDDEGTDALLDYFGKIVIDFGLKEALSPEANCLTPYYYHPHIVDLTENEAYEYIEISQKLGNLMHGGIDNASQKNRDKPGLIEMLLLRRARICASAYNKTAKLFELIKEQYRNKSHILIYCGDGQVEDEAQDAGTIKQTKLVLKELGKELGMKVHPFTSEESMEEREDIKYRFASGSLQVIVAIRCLDEGVNIPATQTAFILASSTNPRQFIQRRGRVLRKSPDKEYAVIHDFIIAPPGFDLYSNEDTFNIERNLFAKELKRINEFAGLALNGAQAKRSLLDIREKYNLLDI